MLASELIKNLKDFIKKNGDLPVIISDIEWYQHITEKEIKLLVNVLTYPEEDLSEEEIDRRKIPKVLLIGYDFL